jgi:putative transposase
MRRRRFLKKQIITILKEHQAGLSAAELCEKHGISDATFCKWRSKFGRVEVSGAKRLRALEEENERLKKLLAGMMMDVATLREILERTVFAQIETESRPSRAGPAMWGKVRVFNPTRVANARNLSLI